MAEPLRLNIGSGGYALPGYLSLDQDPAAAPDVVARVPPLAYDDSSVAAIYCGHLLEHLAPAAGAALLAECYRVLVPGGTLGVVVPDTRRIMRRYVEGANTVDYDGDGHPYAVADLDDVCAYWLYSTYQPSPHLWSYDLCTLQRALERVGFIITGEIDRYHDPRLSNLSNGGAWYQCGWDAQRPPRE